MKFGDPKRITSNAEWAHLERTTGISFGHSPKGLAIFVLLRYRKLMCNKHISLAKPRRNIKMAESMPSRINVNRP